MFKLLLLSVLALHHHQPGVCAPKAEPEETMGIKMLKAAALAPVNRQSLADKVRALPLAPGRMARHLGQELGGSLRDRLLQLDEPTRPVTQAIIEVQPAKEIEG